jgi:hypothetical protein
MYAMSLGVVSTRLLVPGNGGLSNRAILQRDPTAQQFHTRLPVMTLKTRELFQSRHDEDIISSVSMARHETTLMMREKKCQGWAIALSWFFINPCLAPAE